MDHGSGAGAGEKSKKPAQLKSLLYAKMLDREKLIEHFLENYQCVPQEQRLAFWKFMLNVWTINPKQYSMIDLILKDHYDYLKQTVQNVFKLNYKNDNELNYSIYLLDKDLLQLNESDIFKNSKSQSFCLIFKQISDILDDAADFELYYLSAKFYEHLRENLKTMKEKFYAYFQKDLATKNLIEQIEIDQIFQTALSNVFNDIQMYQIIWDHLVVGDFDLLICTMISIFENLKNDHLKNFLFNSDHSCNDLLQKLGLDESKILRTAFKYYKSINNITN